MDEDEWIYDAIMCDESITNEYMIEGVNAMNNTDDSVMIDCSDAFITCEV